MTDIDRLVTTADEQRREDFDWGNLVWADSGELTGTDALTVGRVTIEAGERNPEHRHPNCDEALYVLAGTLRHTIGDEERRLTAGDLIHVPRGERHRAVNDGAEDAVAVIAYDTGEREFEPVE
jgi:quercetin dioxygenase-like cupin family protein